MFSAEKFLKQIYLYSLHKRLPSGSRFLELCKGALAVLNSENAEYRPRLDGTDIPGALLDFSLRKNLPVIVVPDIHARADFVYNILNFSLAPEISGLENTLCVVDALDGGLCRVICVGDILHAESRAAGRWASSHEFFSRDCWDSSFMREEMREGFAAEEALMECKIRWPEFFHILKGNHENIKNEQGGGNFPFRKFASEGEMVYRFVLHHYGSGLLDALYNFEKALPLAACTENLFVSHAEPKRFFSRKDLIQGAFDEETVFGLTWTANGDAERGGVLKMLETFCRPKTRGVRARYIGGHRPVRENYLTRQGGLYIQIHNPGRQNIAVVRPDRTFEPERDIVSVE